MFRGFLQSISFLFLYFLFSSSVPLKEVKYSITLTKRQLADTEMLLTGAFAPLKGFMTKADYDSTLENMRLENGALWPIPIVLDIDEELASKLSLGDMLGLKDVDDSYIALLKVAQMWLPDKEREMRCVYGTESEEHPGVFFLRHKTKNWYVGGSLHEIKLPEHYDFKDLRRTPEELKKYLKENGIERVVAFQTRNPMHRAHFELTKRAAEETNAHLLLHPIVGPTKDDDVDAHTRVRCYREILKYYPENSVTLSVLPLAMRMAGPREAVWHALIRKNFGCTHFIVGRDHAGPGKGIYEPYAAQKLVMKYAQEIGIEAVPFKMMGYLEEEDRYLPVDEVIEGKKLLTISGTELRKKLREGLEIPYWFTFPEVVKHLKAAFLPVNKQGLTIFITGLSASGKSNLGMALEAKLKETQSRPISFYDGNVVRKMLCSDLGFSKHDRSINVRRVGFVASEVSKSGGIAICCMIAPYEEDRQFVRNLAQGKGNYVEIYLSTPLEICEKRDTKNLYAKARAGLITHFTGIDDPYEIPKNPDLTIDTTHYTPEACADLVIEYLKQKGYIKL